MAPAHDRATKLQKELDETRADPILSGHQALLEGATRDFLGLVSRRTHPESGYQALTRVLYRFIYDFITYVRLV